uniref:Uncharacterized protein n=1 Tax=Lactuca sativa TaxID=4236 RepID=A0A9R1XGE8_LACSA|nr:hypothetical protein LSAT_V11C400189060 [Lactuca sativa]
MFGPKSNIRTSETLSKPNHSINTRTQVRGFRFGPNSSALPQGESPFFCSKCYQPNSNDYIDSNHWFLRRIRTQVSCMSRTTNIRR